MLECVMKRLLAAVAVVTMLVGSSALAFDPADLKKLRETNECASCDLSQADLFNDELTNANLIGADLTGTNLSSANLSYTDLTYANLSGTDLSFIDLIFARMNGTIFCDTTMPDGSVKKYSC